MIAKINYFFRTGQTSLLVVDEIVKINFAALTFKIFSPIQEILDMKMIQLLESGIMQRGKFVKKPTIVEKIGPQVMTMEHLEIGFLACFVPLMMSVVAFLLELGSALIERLLRLRKQQKARQQLEWRKKRKRRKHKHHKKDRPQAKVNRRSCRVEPLAANKIICVKERA